MSRALLALTLAISIAGITVAAYNSETIYRKMQDRLVTEPGSILEHDGRRFVVQKLREK